MAVYSTGSSKFNNKSKKLKLGISLICVFSVLLLLVTFNLFKILNIIIYGSIGLTIFPICISGIVLGILFVLGKEIKAPKSLIMLSIAWICVLILILQMFTSKNIDGTFGEYINTTFKTNITAGGVLFGCILYPIYYITYSLATYIILGITLIILSAFIIDKFYVYRQNKVIIDSSQNIKDTNTFVDEDFVDEDELALQSQCDYQPNDDDNIFINDEEEYKNSVKIQEDEERSNAKSILGLSDKKQSIIDEQKNKSNNNKDYLDSLEVMQDNYKENNSNSKPGIFIHEDSFDNSVTINNYRPNQNSTKSKEQIKAEQDAERRRLAAEYLGVSRGQFTTKNQPGTIFDNVKPIETTKTSGGNIDIPIGNTSNGCGTNIFNDLNKQNNENSSRLDQKDNIGKNPFINFDEQINLTDENMSKPKITNFGHNSNNQNNSIINSYTGFEQTSAANEVYNGEVKKDIVDTSTQRPIINNLEPPHKTEQQKPHKPQPYVRPPLNLLLQYEDKTDENKAYMEEKGIAIVETLKSFKIDAHVVNITTGPTFTQFELQLAPGIPVKTIANKVDDLSMTLEANCRLLIPIPGKNAFGIEIPNKVKQTVGIREVLESNNFSQSKSPLTFALGKDIYGECKVTKLDKLVHTLVAGTTGSGKSVCLTTMLLSLLYKASPDELKILLVDPKNVEFTPFNNIPHMLIPKAIDDCNRAIAALGWLIDEMERRYKKLQELQVKNIGEYNDSPEVKSGQIPKMYYILMIFDEVADFMSQSKKEIEEKVKRLTAKSRASGIYLVLATQKPTSDVFSSTIKANLPSRIGLKVSSNSDSRVILEQTGAEKLLGYGDMLFSCNGSMDLDRIQGCYVDTKKELIPFLNFIRDNNPAEFDESIEEEMFNPKSEGTFDSNNGAEGAFDNLLKDCLKFFIKSKRCSTSSLQSNFGIGFPRANKIIAQMERAGFVSPSDSKGRHNLYITAQEFAERFGEEIDE